MFLIPLLVLELAMLGGGLYILTTSKIPKFLLGGRRGGEYQIGEGMARLLGLLMILPLPCALITVFFIWLITQSPEAVGIAVFAGIGFVMGTAILVSIIYLIARKPVPFDPSQLEGGPDNP